MPAPHTTLTGWYQLHPDPATARTQAATLTTRWGHPRPWPSTHRLLPRTDRKAA